MENSFTFDAGNLEKLKIACQKRDIKLSEIITVFTDKDCIESNTYADNKTNEPRFIATGKSHRDRIISVIFVKRNGKIRPFNVWQTKGKKLREYHEQKAKLRSA
jgi:uncharacterized DUF497 family protein